MLVNIENKKEWIGALFDELKKNKEIIEYENKLEIMTKLDKIHVCQVCLKTRVNNPLSCSHKSCIDYYKDFDKCRCNHQKID